MGGMLAWINDGKGDGSGSTFKTSTDAGTGSGSVTCGTKTHATKVEAASNYIFSTIGTYAAKTPVAACVAGEVKLTARNWVNSNVDAKYKAFDAICLALSKAGTPKTTYTNTDGKNDVVAAVDATKKTNVNLAGSGTPSICGTSTGVHTPNLKNSVGSFTFTPSFPSVEFYKGTTGMVNFGGGAAFGSDSVC